MKSWPALNEALRVPLTAAELEEIDRASADLARRLEALEGSQAPLNFEALALARHRASNTLRVSPEDVPRWETALARFGNDLASGAEFSFEKLAAWNRILRGAHGESDPLRKEEMYLSERKLVPVDEIEGALADFNDFAVSAIEDPVLKASRLYQWIITIHPFPNANGRSARLAADYVLMQNGYLPLVFPSPQGSFVAIWSSEPKAITPMQAYLRVRRGVERSIEILQLPRL